MKISPKAFRRIPVSALFILTLINHPWACENVPPIQMEVQSGSLEKEPAFMLKTFNGKSEVIESKGTMLYLNIDINMSKDLANISNMYYKCHVKIDLDETNLFDGTVSSIFSLPDYRFYYQKFGLPLEDQYIVENKIREKAEKRPIRLSIKISKEQ